MRLLPLLFLLTPAALFISCKDEQRLYSYQADEEEVAEIQASATRSLPQPTPAPAANSAESAPLPDIIPGERWASLSDEDAITIVAAGVRLTVPKKWQAGTPSSSMRVAQYLISGPENAAPAELAVFHRIGGTAEENIKRWVGQVTPDEPPLTATQSVNGLVVHELIVHGTVQPTGMGSGPTQPLSDSTLYGIIIEGGPQDSLFIKVTGPRATIDAAAPALARLAETARPEED